MCGYRSRLNISERWKIPKITKRFRCVGFLFQERTSIEDLWDAFDWRDREFLGEDLARELGHGCHPDGMLIKAVDGDKIGVVLNGEVKVLA